MAVSVTFLRASLGLAIVLGMSAERTLTMRSS